MAFEWASIDPEDGRGPRPARVALELESSLILGSDRVKVTVLDLSRTGVRLRVPEPLFAGETFELEMGRSGYARIRICWSQGNEAGAVFVDL